MSFYVYGLRLIGDTECRYVGQTSRTPEERLEYRAREVERRFRRSKPNPGSFEAWLMDNKGNIETFKIAKIETRAEAHGHEKAIVALILRLNHRLFNHWLVPPELRIGWKPYNIARRQQEAA